MMHPAYVTMILDQRGQAIDSDNAFPVDVLGGMPVDAFGRMRVSDPVTVFDSGHQYLVNPLVWETITAGTGSVSHLPDESTALLSTGGTASGARAALQTKAYHRYQPGKSQLVMQTAVFGEPAENVVRRYGYFDDENGLFFEQTAEGMHVVVRSSATGAVVEQRVNQADWNLDKLDNAITSPSRIVADWSKAQIFLTDMEWLGVGRVRFGIVLGGEIVYVHEFAHINDLSGVYMTTANLPVRAEIENTGVAAATATMKQICVTVMSEGGQEEDRAFLHSVGNGITTVPVTIRRAVLSIRPKLTINGRTNRGQVVPREFAVFSDSNAYYEVVLGGTLGGTPVWNSVPGGSAVEFDVAGTTVTGGVVVESGYVTTGGGAARGSGGDDLLGRLPLVLNAAGTAADVLSVVVTSFSGTAATSAAATWKEFR